MGIQQGEKVFLKRNTSPFVTALSAEGFVPKLMWTQRTYSGDTLTAQEWKDGTLLRKKDMASMEVIDLIYHIHHSSHLLMMLRRVGGRSWFPENFIHNFLEDLPPSLASHHYIHRVTDYLEANQPQYSGESSFTVCHGDLHHHNFLKSDEGQLYLVDWDNVRIADPLSDITRVLVQYYPPSEWTTWFQRYDYPTHPTFYEDVQWYSAMNCLFLIKQYFQEGRQHKVNYFILLLKSILNIPLN